MRPLDLDSVREYVNDNIGEFHQGRIDSLRDLDIGQMLKKNPYLYRAKNVLTASDMVAGTMDAFLSSSEEQRFGVFLEGLALFVARQTTDGFDPGEPGVDLEFVKDGIYWVVQIKSGPNWGNSSQQNQLEQDLADRVRFLRAERPGEDIRAMLGICYGKVRTSHIRGYLKVVGQNFWYFISENPKLYQEIVEPIGYRAEEHNEAYEVGKAQAAKRLTRDFIKEYCDPSGAIDWPKLIEDTCGNYDLHKFNLGEFFDD